MGWALQAPVLGYKHGLGTGFLVLCEHTCPRFTALLELLGMALPTIGARIDSAGWTFEVRDLDDRRTGKVLARPSCA